MHQADLDRVVFFSKDDLTSVHQLKKAEAILKRPTSQIYYDINDILELYNIKKYIDKDLYLKTWTDKEISEFKQKASEYGKAIGKFMSGINDLSVIKIYELTFREYINSFWELFNNQLVFKRISRNHFNTIISKEPNLIHAILNHKNLVDHYNIELKMFMLSYSKSAEILLSFFEVGDRPGQNLKFIPKSLSIEEKEDIISKYLDSNDANFNYIELIQNVRNRNDFKISDRTRLKAKRLHKTEIETLFKDSDGLALRVSISFPSNAIKIRDAQYEKLNVHYSYSMDFVKEHNDPYALFQNFKILFDYVDIQNRINLLSKTSQLGVFERITGIHSKNEYRTGLSFNFLQMTSHAKIIIYYKIVAELNNSLENILLHVFTISFKEKHGFADNARFSFPPATNSYFEKVRLLAPEFESVLKQFKLFVEEGSIDFELLQISSSPPTLKDIPSLNQNKYLYANDSDEEMVGCSNLFFSDQTLLTFVDPFKEKQYSSFFDLLTNEQVQFNNYAEHQKYHLNYLIGKGFISIGSDNLIQIANPIRMLILKDLYYNEVASFYRYPLDFQLEAKRMYAENIVSFESTLFSKPEQAYFNYFLNKSEFTNGLDLRNSYLHGTQANSEEEKTHEHAYFKYLKLLSLTMLKIEDDLQISNTNK